MGENYFKIFAKLWIFSFYTVDCSETYFTYTIDYYYDAIVVELH